MRVLPLGVALVAVGILLGLRDPGAAPLPFVVLAVAWGLAVAALPDPRWTPGLTAAAAFLARAPLLGVEPTLSDDVWRYVWEGEVWRAGFNPFVLAPDDPALAALRDTAWAHVNHRSVPSIYPPFAQLLFLLLAPGGVLAWRILSAAADVGTAYLLARARPRAGVLWALLPLPAIESAVSGHLEGIGVFFLVLAITRREGIWAWLGAMTKLLPAVLLALEPPRRWFAWAALTLAVTLPIVRVTGFETYRAHWSFNGSLFPLLEAALGAPARPLAQLIGAVVVGGILLRSRDPARVALWTTGAFVLLSPTVHPWYVLWPLAAALVNGSAAWTVLGALVPLSYAVLATRDATGAWSESVAVRWIEYTPFYLALLLEAWRRATRPGPASIG